MFLLVTTLLYQSAYAWRAIVDAIATKMQTF